uniref:Putative cytochrome n=1 Tax=Ixodes scapularis TaxID=6945 RepID=A0A4D5RJP9_IXOSC
MNLGYGVFASSMLCLLASFLLLLWRWRRRTFAVFEGTGIRGPEPNLISGNFYQFWTKDMQAVLESWASRYGDIFGFYNGDAPMVAVKDLDLLRRVFVSDFKNFCDRGIVFRLVGENPAVRSALSVATGHRWKEVRRCVAQAFTTSKLRPLVPGMEAAVDEFLDILREKAADGQREVDVCPLLDRVAFDMVARTAFGVKLDVQRKPEEPLFQESKLLLRKSLSGIFNKLAQFFSGVKGLLPILMFLEDLFNTQAFSALAKLSEPIIQHRKQNPTLARPDLMQHLLDAEITKQDDPDVVQQGDQSPDRRRTPPAEKGRMSIEDAASNAANMLQAGFETVSLTLSFCFFRVAKHQDIQDNVREEVISVLAKHGALNYEAISELQYTSQVLNETLRVHGPVTAFTSRMTNQDYKYQDVLLRRGFSVIACSHLVHKDPNLWPEPDKFDPERFSPEQSSSRDPLCFQGYGMGPRICVGSKLAQLEMALVLAKVLLHFRLELGQRGISEGRLETAGYSIMEAPRDGVWLKLHELEQPFPKCSG